MKSKRLIKILVIINLTLPILSFNSSGEKIISSVKELFKSSESKEAVNLEELYDMNFDEILAVPELGKYADIIRQYQKQKAIAIKKSGYKTELMRNGEVIVVSIPVSDLFMPEDSIMLEKADLKLRPFLQYLVTPDFYRIALVVNSDDTGTSRYTYNMTKSRVQTIMSWFESQNANTDYIIPYAMGQTLPLKPNNSLLNRAENRRLEIYLIPGTEMIRMTKKELLTF